MQEEAEVGGGPWRGCGPSIAGGCEGLCPRDPHKSAESLETQGLRQLVGAEGRVGQVVGAAPLYFVKSAYWTNGPLAYIFRRLCF